MKKWWHSRRVRLRLTLWFTGTLTFILLAYAAGVYGILKHTLYNELDRELRHDVKIANLKMRFVAKDQEGLGTQTSQELDPNAENPYGNEVWTDARTLFFQKTSVPALSLGPLPTSCFGMGDVPRTEELSAGVYARVYCRPDTVKGQPVIIRVARSEEVTRHELMELFLILALGIPFAVGICGVGGYLLARRALAPVGKLVAKAKQITAEHLGELLPVDNPHDELGCLASTFNETFRRLEGSFNQMRRFTADASHELRTPLAAIRSTGEVALARRQDEQTYRDTISSILEETDQMRELVDNLLMLSRVDAGQVRLRPEPLLLSNMAREVAHQLEALADENGKKIVIDANGSGIVAADRVVLRQAIINLVDNAIKYSPKDTVIRIRVFGSETTSTVEVSDEGPGIALEHQSRIFDRFYCCDKARSRAIRSTGLGLSIAKWAVEGHGGKIEVESTVGVGSTFRITLPNSGQTSSDSVDLPPPSTEAPDIATTH